MSRTASPGVVGPSHWAYMATVMAKRLQRMIETKKLSQGDVPDGVYQRVREFFDLALQGKEDVPDNPPASINAFLIAAEALKGSNLPPLETRQQLQNRLQDFGSLIERLSRPGDMSPSELETAASLRDFFLQLKEAGDLEAYDTRVAFDEPPAVGIRLYRRL